MPDEEVPQEPVPVDPRVLNEISNYRNGLAMMQDGLVKVANAIDQFFYLEKFDPDTLIVSFEDSDLAGDHGVLTAELLNQSVLVIAGLRQKISKTEKKIISKVRS